jgi:hypothetical protein
MGPGVRERWTRWLRFNGSCLGSWPLGFRVFFFSVALRSGRRLKIADGSKISE